MRLHADVPVRLSDGIEIEVKHVREGDRLATADGGSVTVSSVDRTVVSDPRWVTVSGYALRALKGTSVLQGRSFVPIDAMDAVLVEEETGEATVYTVRSKWCVYNRIPAIRCGGLHVEIRDR